MKILKSDPIRIFEKKSASCEPLPCTTEGKAAHDKRCTCYDNECRDVVNHFVCFMGDDYVGGIADGYCPWLR